MPKCYAFDVDETLWVSRGPVQMQSMIDLRAQGHIVGICGNWGYFVQQVPNWHALVSFINLSLMVQDQTGKIHGDKAWYLRELKNYVRADEYIMVGNVFGRVNSLGKVCGSHDSEAAEAANWRFIVEDDFANGVR